MPTYKYKREDGTTFEIKQGINEEALERCPETGQKVKRVISGGGGVVYKGDGWYVTDYKDNDKKEKAKAEKPSDNSGNNSSEQDSTDTKSSSSSASTDSND